MMARVDQGSVSLRTQPKVNKRLELYIKCGRPSLLDYRDERDDYYSTIPWTGAPTTARLGGTVMAPGGLTGAAHMSQEAPSALADPSSGMVVYL